MHHVDLVYLCAANKVSERVLKSVLHYLISCDGSQTTIKAVAESVDYSPDQTKRAIRALSLGGIVARKGGKRGIPYGHHVNRDRACALLGSLTDAA